MKESLIGHCKEKNNMNEFVDSGVEWIGSLPSNWNVVAIRYMINEQFTGVWGEEEKYNDNDRICVRIADFDYDRLKFKELNKEDYTVRNYNQNDISKKTLHYGDLLIEKSGGGEKTPVGRAVVYKLPYKALFANFMDCIRFKGELYIDYAKYVFSALYRRGVTNFYYNQTIGLQNLNMSKFFREVKIPMPPMMTQVHIAEYLDFKCSKIDELIQIYRQEIDILQAYKRSVITETVTKGINKNAKMKYSGIEWVGEIPSSWSVHPVYYYFKERKNKNVLLNEKNLLSLSYGRIVRKDIYSVGGLLPNSFTTYNIVEVGDIIIRPTDLQNDKRSLRTGLVKERGIITSAYIDLAPKCNINSEFFHYLLHSYDIKKVFYNMGNGVRQGLNYSEFSKLLVFAPEREEQDKVVLYLNEKCRDVDCIIEQKQSQLENLNNYKKSIIFEYVTGKKEVV